MIHYALICDNGDNFEGWFRDSASFDAQVADGQIVCPFCASTRVTRGVMAPHVARVSEESAERLREKLRALHDAAIEGTEDVGDRFPQEARKIEEEGSRRAIRGRATFEEAKALLEDGISIMPIPGLPSDGN